MLGVIFLEDLQGFYNLDFLGKNREKALIVCPSPIIADNVRNKLLQKQTPFKDVITLSKFLQDEMRKYNFPKEKFKRKSQLFLVLASLWKEYYKGESDFSAFSHSFNIFTELRGVTLNPEVFLEILNQLDEAERINHMLFWSLLKEKEILDEQEAYYLLSKSIEKNEESRTLVFHGIKHLSGVQVDFLNSQSKVDDVWITYPRKVFLQSGPRDWINWIESESLNELGREEERLEKKPVNVLYYSQNKLGPSIKDKIFSNKGLLDKNLNIYFAKDSISLGDVNSLPGKDISFRVPNEIYKEKGKSTVNKIRRDLLKNGILKTKEVKEIIEKDIQFQFQLKSPLEKGTNLAPLFLLKEKVIEWESLLNDKIGLFDLEVLNESFQLDFPRNYFIPLLKTKKIGEVKGLNDLNSFSPEESNILIIPKRNNVFQSGGPLLPKSILSIISNFGPIKRDTINNEFFKYFFSETIGKDNSNILIEGTHDELDSGWKDLFSEYEVISASFKSSPSKKVQDVISSLVKFEKNIPSWLSASYLQDYHDCPRKFSFKYFGPGQIFPKSNSRVGFHLIGSLEHEIIQKWFGGGPEKELNALVRSLFEELIQREKLELDYFEKEKTFLELYKCSRNGINSLEVLRRDPRFISLEFERDLTVSGNNKIKGSVDCVVNFTNGTALLDFKRSSSSIPSKKDFLNMDSIQIWFYLLYVTEMKDSGLMWGYLNLTDPEKSLIFTKDNELFKEMGSLTSPLFFEDDLVSELDRFTEKIEIIDTKIKEDEEFLPHPRNSKVCDFCQFRNVCFKNGNLNESRPK